MADRAASSWQLGTLRYVALALGLSAQERRDGRGRTRWGRTCWAGGVRMVEGGG